MVSSQTDEFVMGYWTENYSDLVILEYRVRNWSDDNAFLLNRYSDSYGNEPSVPTIFLANSVLSGLDPVKRSEDLISPSACFLSDGQRANFDSLDLNDLGDVRIFANGRVLVRTGDGRVSSDVLRELLFSDGPSKVLSESGLSVVDSDIRAIEAGSFFIVFDKRVELNGSWVFMFNEANTLK